MKKCVEARNLSFDDRVSRLVAGRKGDALNRFGSHKIS